MYKIKLSELQKGISGIYLLELAWMQGIYYFDDVPFVI